MRPYNFAVQNRTNQQSNNTDVTTKQSTTKPETDYEFPSHMATAE